MFDRISEKLGEVFKNIRGQGRLSEKNISRALREVRLALLDADVNYRVVKEIVEKTRRDVAGTKVLRSLKPGQQFIKIFHDHLVGFMTDDKNGLSLKNKPAVIMLVGLQGSGKTAMAAKLALWLKNNDSSASRLVIAADRQRPAAVRQLEILGEKIGEEIYTGEGNSALKIVRDGLKYARSKRVDRVIVDTAGRLHVDEELMGELGKIKNLLKPDEILLVVDAMTGQDAVNVACDFDRRIGISGAIMTKLDGDARGGAAISFRSVTGRPIKLIGTGEKLDDIQRFDPERLVSRILGMGDIVSLAEKAQQTINKADARKWEKKWKRAEIDLEDFRNQIRQLRKVGSWETIAGMLPRGLPDLGDGERKINRMEAILDSMTSDEKRKPAIINGSRRQRIARGSGTTVQEVNQLLKQFKLMKKMMTQAGKLGKKKIKLGGANWPL